METLFIAGGQPPSGPSVRHALIPGGRIDRFRLSAKLGQGASGIVFAADDERCGRKVALKILRETADREQKRRFLREGAFAAAVRHPNLAEVFETIDAPGYSLIVMELVSGKTLRALLREAVQRGGRLSLEETLRIVRRVARGLAAAHQAGIIHRDVKPENVMITEDGQTKLLDFGIAKVCGLANPLRGSAYTRAPPTEKGVLLGTPAYMSPEQGRGEPIGVATDVFSIGIMFYEMLTSTKPFVGDTMLEVLVAIAFDQPPPPSRHKLGVDSWLDPVIDSVVLRCLQKDPRARYLDASHLLGDLMALSRLAGLAKTS